MGKLVYIVGIGMDGDRTMTKEACEAVSKAQVLIGAQRMVDSVVAGGISLCGTVLVSEEELRGRETFISYDSDRIAQFICTSDKHMFAVLMSGDCGFYSGAKKLLPLLEDMDVRVVSGVSSLVYFCNRIGKPWQETTFVSLHGAEGNIVRKCASHQYTFFLLGGDVTPQAACRRLTEHGLGNVHVYVGERLAMEDEKIHSAAASQLVGLDTDRLCVMLVENESYKACQPTGISDEAFIRAKVPMTKAEVRSVIMSRLRVKRDDVCWDIGSGSGSVTVEMALQCEDGCVHAVERKPEALELTGENARRFYCDNVTLHPGEAARAVQELPAPDVVFVGGSGGQLRDIAGCAYHKNPQARMVVTAVSLETLQEAVSVMEEFGLEADVVQVAVTRTRKIAGHTMFDALNPIFVITAVKERLDAADIVGGGK